MPSGFVGNGKGKIPKCLCESYTQCKQTYNKKGNIRWIFLWILMRL